MLDGEPAGAVGHVAAAAMHPDDAAVLPMAARGTSARCAIWRERGSAGEV